MASFLGVLFFDPKILYVVLPGVEEGVALAAALESLLARGTGAGLRGFAPAGGVFLENRLSMEKTSASDSSSDDENPKYFWNSCGAENVARSK